MQTPLGESELQRPARPSGSKYLASVPRLCLGQVDGNLYAQGSETSGARSCWCTDNRPASLFQGIPCTPMPTRQMVLSCASRYRREDLRNLRDSDRRSIRWVESNDVLEGRARMSIARVVECHEPVYAISGGKAGCICGRLLAILTGFLALTRRCSGPALALASSFAAFSLCSSLRADVHHLPRFSAWNDPPAFAAGQPGHAGLRPAALAPPEHLETLPQSPPQEQRPDAAEQHRAPIL